MRERFEVTKAFVGAFSNNIKEQVSRELDSRASSLNLYEYPWARRIIDLRLREIKVQPMPEGLKEGERAILVSNYPSVKGTTLAVLKVGCRLPGKEARLKAIAREEVIREADLFLKAIGVGNLVFPAKKIDGAYRLERKIGKDVLNYLKEPGRVLWMSITGNTEGNGLLEEHKRTGAVVFSSTSQVPIIPMGVVTEQKGEKRRVVQVKFGEPIIVPSITGLTELDKDDFKIDCTELVMCKIASLLPYGQRGSFEEAKERLIKIRKRLEAYSTS